MPFLPNDTRINRNGRPVGSLNKFNKRLQETASYLLDTIELQTLSDKDKIRLLEVMLRHSLKSNPTESLFDENFTIKFDFEY